MRAGRGGRRVRMDVLKKRPEFTLDSVVQPRRGSARRRALRCERHDVLGTPWRDCVSQVRCTCWPTVRTSRRRRSPSLWGTLSHTRWPTSMSRRWGNRRNCVDCRKESSIDPQCFEHVKGAGVHGGGGGGAEVGAISSGTITAWSTTGLFAVLCSTPAPCTTSRAVWGGTLSATWTLNVATLGAVDPFPVVITGLVYTDPLEA